MRRVLRHLLLICALPSGALACGFESPQTIALGTLNFAYPDALHVGTAVWQARQQGLLPPSDPGYSDPARDGVVRLWQALRTLDGVKQRLATTRADKDPALAVVLLPAVMWSRLLPSAPGLGLLPHVSGPESGDVVLITESDALQAWLERRLDAETLLGRGLLRVYGDNEAVAALKRWLQRADPKAE